MRKLIALLLGATLVASFSGTATGAELDSPRACADIYNGEGVYEWANLTNPTNVGQMSFTTQLLEPSCTDVEYHFAVIPDAGTNEGVPLDQGSDVTPIVSSLSGDGTSALNFSLSVPDDDPVVCVYGWTTGIETVGGPVDLNGNGNFNDDQHRNNPGNNKDGHKHDWETETREVTYDRAPDDDQNPDSIDDCVYLVSPPYHLLPGSPARGYN